MNVNLNGFSGLFSALAIFAALASAVFWMVIGWRAMRAHERIAAAAEQAARNQSESRGMEE